jgi:hypothetical protein
LRPGKAGEALALGLAVEVVHPLACELSGPVSHQHLGRLSLVSRHFLVPDARERTPPGHPAKVDHLPTVTVPAMGASRPRISQLVVDLPAPAKEPGHSPGQHLEGQFIYD